MESHFRRPKADRQAVTMPHWQVNVLRLLLYDEGTQQGILSVPYGQLVATASTMKELQNRIMEVPLSSFIYHVRKNDFSRWLRAQSLYHLASILKPITMKSDGSDAEMTRELIYSTIKNYRKERTRGSIAHLIPIPATGLYNNSVLSITPK